MQNITASNYSVSEEMSYKSNTRTKNYFKTLKAC